MKQGRDCEVRTSYIDSRKSMRLLEWEVMPDDTPPHIGWLKDSGQTVKTVDGRTVELWTLEHVDDPAILTSWAKHFREHYCWDHDLAEEVKGTGLSKADFLQNMKFPSAKTQPGPGSRRCRPPRTDAD